LEIILIDDGSSDKSGKIADEFEKKDRRAKVVHKQNEGVSVAKNLGVHNATGKLITFIDADDYIREDFIENLVSDMTKYNTFIATTATEICPINEDNSEIVETYSRYEAFEKMFYDTLEKSNNGIQMFDRQLLIENKMLFDPEKKVGEDFDFFTQALSHCDKVAVDYRKMYYYRPNPASTMHQKINEGLMRAVTNFSSIGEKLVEKYPDLQKAIDSKKFNDSVSLSMRSYHVRQEWKEDFEKLEYNIRSLKWQVLFDSKAREKVRVAAFVYCIFGNHIGTIILRRIKK
jgi:glycosyltransferase involved in cell wall biosynthesis